MCLDTRACAEPTTPGVWWRDDADWKQYDVSQAAVIQRGIADGASRVDLGQVASSKYARGAHYVVDLCSMKQCNLSSGYTRDVKVVDVKAPAVITKPVLAPQADDHNSSMKEELRACKKSIRSLKNMVLKLESDLLAVRFQLLDNTVKRVAVTAANQAVDGFKPRCASRGVCGDAVCERCNEAWDVHSLAPEYQSEDEY